jgi:hypothetical protein
VIDADEVPRIGLAGRIAALPQPAIRTDHEAVVLGFGRLDPQALVERAASASTG